MPEKPIRFFGQQVTGQCHKAWGMNNRPREVLALADRDDALGTEGVADRRAAHGFAWSNS